MTTKDWFNKAFRKRDLATLTSIGIVSGVFNFLFLMALNYMISLLIQQQYTQFKSEYALVFAIIILIYIWCRRLLSFGIIQISQKLFWLLRIDVLRTVLKANYEQLLQKKEEIHATLIHDVRELTNASLTIIDFVTSSVVLIACFSYMAYLSVPLFLITLGTAVAGILIYQIGAIKNNRAFEQARDQEQGFMKYFNALLDGFKEIYIEPQKGKDIFTLKIKPIAQAGYNNNTRAFIGYLNNQLTGQILFYALIASIVLFFSLKLSVESAVIINFLFLLLFLLGSIETIMVLLPGLVRARIAAQRLVNLKDQLEREGFDEAESYEQIPRELFRQIEIQNLEFAYQKSNHSFCIGPINLKIEQSDVVFIYGGNGSGKTTLIHSLLGLLVPDSGKIQFNDEVVASGNYARYRSLFAVVFNEFYLFDEFYGLGNINLKEAKAYLEIFEMENKVDVNEKGFSSVDLSTGQRKRLALIVAILEKKPILVLDEWAADQDPVFRKKFYKEIIPLLKSEGFTVIAITHDDAYYGCADKLVKMEYGKLTLEQIAQSEVFKPSEQII